MLSRYRPQAGAGGAQFFLFFDFITALNLSKLHFPSLKYFKQPTMDLTWFCKNDFDWKLKIILSLFFFILIKSKFRIGDFAPHEEDLKVEKSLFFFKINAPFFIKLILRFFLMCQALL